MNKSKFLLASIIALSLILGPGHNAYAWPWSKKGSNTTEIKQKKKKNGPKKKHKKNSKKNRKNTR